MEEKTQKIIKKVRESGARVTPQRFAVMDFLLHSKRHPTADDIHKELIKQFPNISLATVYNNLRVLCEMGLVRELTYGNNSSRYDGNTTDHYHIICSVCGEIVDFHYPILDEIEILAEQTTGFDIAYHRMEIYGTCKQCQEPKNNYTKNKVG